ncbi:hypothetical protein FPK69_21740, partial [Acinetobacter baumannii]|nr:hypothetical protein [Acinetobacter baumannii]
MKSDRLVSIDELKSLWSMKMNLNRSFKNNYLFVELNYKNLPTDPNAKKLIKDFPESYYSKITNT